MTDESRFEEPKIDDMGLRQIEEIEGGEGIPPLPSHFSGLRANPHFNKTEPPFKIIQVKLCGETVIPWGYACIGAPITYGYFVELDDKRIYVSGEELNTWIAEGCLLKKIEERLELTPPQQQ